MLNDHKRVLVQLEVVRVLTGGADTSNLARYLLRNPLIKDELYGGPITFKIPSSGNEAIRSNPDASTLSSRGYFSR